MSRDGKEGGMGRVGDGRDQPFNDDVKEEDGVSASVNRERGLHTCTNVVGGNYLCGES